MNKQEIKQYLMSGQFLSALPGRKYFSLEELYAKLSRKCPDLKKAQLSRRMFDLVKNGKIYGAGRGKYPRLDFSCWSTKQVRSFMHHLLAKFVTFIYTQWEAMEPMGDLLESEGYKK